VCRSVENSYSQQVSDRQLCEHEMPVDLSRITRWCKRLGKAGAEAILKVLTSTQASHVNINTTLQIRAIRYPPDARLYDRVRERLVVHARKAGLSMKQSCASVGRHLVHELGRYAHTRQMRQSKVCTRELRTNLGQVIREVEWQGVPEVLTRLLTLCKSIQQQQRRDQAKVYSVYEPEVMCIAKGKAGKRYEFG
jgi:IS5 family transposase